MDQKLKNQLKQKLLEEKVVLEKELKTIARKDPKMKDDWDAKFPQFTPEESGSHASLEESADEVEEYEVNLETEHALETKLRDVNLALEKIEKGSYGTCEECGEEIPEERLEANPAAKFDIEHSEKS